MDADYRRDICQEGNLIDGFVHPERERFKSSCVRLLLILALISLISGCDEEHASELGGGPGGSGANDVATNGNGFCDPQGGLSALGQASVSTSGEARIDSDGDPAAKGFDANWNPDTSGTVNGSPVDSSRYSYVVLSPTVMAQNGVSLGDWALVTNNATHQGTWAKVMDEGPSGGQNEISEAAANAVGIQYTQNRFTVGDPSISVDVYGGSSGVQSDCSQIASVQ